jgi:phosphoribosyl-ATP pyrophosphohydrolase
MIDFEKGGGLVPTVVCDAFDGQPRMLAYSSRESFELAIRERAGVYWSRSRGRLWRKGEESGATQRLIRVGSDCDRDTLLFYVEQTGPTCHLGTDRCFDKRPFTWETLAARVAGRAAAPSGSSYTSKLLAEPALLREKIVEEAVEVTEARSTADVAWECADLLYFMTVKMHDAGVSIADVMSQLAERAR